LRFLNKDGYLAGQNNTSFPDLMFAQGSPSHQVGFSGLFLQGSFHLYYMAVQSQVFRRDPQGQAHQLWQMQDRDPQLAPDHLFHLRLPRVQVEVTQGTGGDQTIGSRLYGLQKMPACHRERLLRGVAGNGPTATLGAPAIPNGGGPQTLEEILHQMGIPRHIKAGDVVGPQQITPVEGSAAQSQERPFDLLGQSLQAVVMNQHPQQMAHIACALVAALAASFLAQGLHLVKVLWTRGFRSLQLFIHAAQHSLTGAAVGKHRQPQRLGQSQVAGIYRIFQQLRFFFEGARTTAGSGFQLHQFNAQMPRNLVGGVVQLTTGPLGHTAGVVGVAQR
jgi:hypothetical protein